MAPVFVENEQVPKRGLCLGRDQLVRLLAAWRGKQLQLLVQVGLDARNVALDLTVERNHEFGLLVVRQNVAVIAVVLRRCLEDCHAFLSLWLGLEISERCLEQLWKL